MTSKIAWLFAITLLIVSQSNAQNVPRPDKNGESKYLGIHSYSHAENTPESKI